ncbi:hypothetical protein ABKN59_007535 [Abortiporus biennis]
MAFPTSLSILLFSLCAPILASPSNNDLSRRGSPPSPFTRRANVPAAGFFAPGSSGGAMLTVVPGTNPPNLGEPLNVIISANSDSQVLVDQEIDGGLRNYFLSFGFSAECLGQHSGDAQGANLGDGLGLRNETAVIRWDYGDSQLGSCKETVEGGNHFRYWVQDGPSANSSAIFMATSYEKPIKQFHDIVVNGYNLGRDWLVGNATNMSSIIDTSSLTNTTTFTGQTTFANFTYQTEAAYTSGLLSATSDGVNHFDSVPPNSISTNYISWIENAVTTFHNHTVDIDHYGQLVQNCEVGCQCVAFSFKSISKRVKPVEIPRLSNTSRKTDTYDVRPVRISGPFDLLKPQASSFRSSSHPESKTFTDEDVIGEWMNQGCVHESRTDSLRTSKFTQIQTWQQVRSPPIVIHRVVEQNQRSTNISALGFQNQIFSIP